MECLYRRLLNTTSDKIGLEGGREYPEAVGCPEIRIWCICYLQGPMLNFTLELGELQSKS